MEKRISTRTLTGLALFTAIVVVLQFLGAFIRFGPFSISLVLIPIVIGAAIYGPKTGALRGATFGVVVTINCITGADLGGQMVFQADPVICILVVLAKGTLAGFLSG